MFEVEFCSGWKTRIELTFYESDILLSQHNPLMTSFLQCAFIDHVFSPMCIFFCIFVKNEVAVAVSTYVWVPNSNLLVSVFACQDHDVFVSMALQCNLVRYCDTSLSTLLSFDHPWVCFFVFLLCKLLSCVFMSVKNGMGISIRVTLNL